MGFIEEFSDLERNWKNSSFGVKVILILSIFCTLSSLASLSEIIVEWKGFILDGLSFYRKYVNMSISNLLKLFGLKLHKTGIDSIVLLSFSVYPLFKYRIVLLTEHWNELPNRVIINFFAMLTSYILVYIYIIYETSNNTPINIVLYWIILIGTVFNLYLVLGHKENRKYAYTVLISILLFFILAAINKGLA